MSCGQELCRNWGGHGCICEVMDLEPDIVREGRDGDPDDEPCARCGFHTTGLLDDDGICPECRYAEDGDGDE